MKQRTKRQHYVPRFYLERFADADGFIWSYDKQEGSCRKARSTDTAVESNFYSPIDENGAYFDQLEDFLASIESKAAPILGKVESGDIPIGEERADFALFLASLYLRGPAMVNAVANSMGELIQVVGNFAFSDRERFDRQMDEADRETGRRTSAEDRQGIIDFYKNKNAWSMEVDRRVGLMMIGSTPDIAQILCDMAWMVVEPQNQHVITSDNPITKGVPSQFLVPGYGDGGFLHKKVIVTVPISGKRVLEIYWGKQLPNGIQRAPKDIGRLYNRLRAKLSERYLYSSRQDQGIANLGAKFNRPGLRLNIDHPSKRAPVHLKRRLRNS